MHQLKKDMATFNFRQIKQESGKSIDEFHRRLKEKARACEFHDEDSEIKTQIIDKASDAGLRRKALRKQLDLKSVLDYGKTLEKSDQSARKLEIAENRQDNESTNHIESNKNSHKLHSR